MAVPVPLRQLFDYLPVAGPLPEPGCRCEIDFGNRRLTGMVWEVVPPGDSDHDPRKLRPLRQVIDDQPVLDSDLRELCQRAAQYYQHPIGEVLQTALPRAAAPECPGRAPGRAGLAPDRTRPLRRPGAACPRAAPATGAGDPGRAPTRFKPADADQPGV